MLRDNREVKGKRAERFLDEIKFDELERRASERARDASREGSRKGRVDEPEIFA